MFLWSQPSSILFWEMWIRSVFKKNPRHSNCEISLSSACSVLCVSEAVIWNWSSASCRTDWVEKTPQHLHPAGPSKCIQHIQREHFQGCCQRRLSDSHVCNSLLLTVCVGHLWDLCCNSCCLLATPPAQKIQLRRLSSCWRCSEEIPH